ncbi:MAG: hypothetical protein PF689_11765 [Deltaproteobacteria bacterium]|jgi:hypothetical protein|nr:hypothetical protein [Deltaproteobacteria bacterium]
MKTGESKLIVYSCFIESGTQTYIFSLSTFLPGFLMKPVLSIFMLFQFLSCSFDTSGLSSSFVEICDNEIDDNGNGLVDCDDPDCEQSSSCQTPDEICDNEIDDDGDELIDCDDPDCDQFAPCQFPDEICDNGLDDDDDTYTDCKDQDCFQKEHCLTGEEICNNNYDDDQDELVDCVDPDCFGVESCDNCDPVNDSGCPDDKSCVLQPDQQYQSSCLSTGGLGEQGDYCFDQSNCSVGFTCWDQSNICLKICYPVHINNDCPPLTSCHSFSDWSLDSPWGICFQ